ncbi:DUF6387 family protein [Dechloromonas sp. H13]|uniref:DUF6387 family protein n=1 Tax=Dechloromonas sp. H13 TaxID=2570193 RepID=UPI0034CFE5CE
MAQSDDAIREARTWFSLENYRTLRTMGLYEWGQQIARRVLIWNSLKLAPNKVFLDNELPKVMADPCSPFEYIIPLTAVKQLTFGDVQLLHELSPCSVPPDSPVDAGAIGNLEYLLPYGHLVIHLGAEDQDIKTAFDYWLQQCRQDKRVSHPSKRKTDTARVLHAKLILPYCDLRAWACWKNFDLKERHLICLLYGIDDPNPDRTQLRTVTNNIKSHINLTCAHALMMSDPRPVQAPERLQGGLPPEPSVDFV